MAFTVFQVIDAHPIPGMFISPKEGVVPVGGTAELKVMFRRPKDRFYRVTEKPGDIHDKLMAHNVFKYCGVHL